MLRLRLLAFFLPSLTKARDNNTPAIKITSSSASLEATFVVRFVAAAFWRGCGQIFVAAASCATKVCSKSLRVSSGLVLQAQCRQTGHCRTQSFACRRFRALRLERA